MDKIRIIWIRILCGAGMIVLLGFMSLFFGCAGYGKMPDIIVYKYDYQAKPPALSPGTMPLPGPPPLADYQTVYDSSFDDPSLVIFKNDSYRKVRIWIDKGKQPIILEPYGATSDLHLGVGEHLVRVAIEKPTAVHGIWTVNQEFTVYVHPEGEAQIFHIYESGY